MDDKNHEKLLSLPLIYDDRMLLLGLLKQKADVEAEIEFWMTRKREICLKCDEKLAEIEEKHNKDEKKEKVQCIKEGSTMENTFDQNNSSSIKTNSGENPSMPSKWISYCPGLKMHRSNKKIKLYERMSQNGSRLLLKNRGTYIGTYDTMEEVNEAVSKMLGI